LLAIAAGLTVLFKSGSILQGAKNLVQSLMVSANNWGNRMPTLGANSKFKPISWFANMGNVGVNAQPKSTVGKAMAQIQTQ
jgi:hypothetical protein